MRGYNTSLGTKALVLADALPHMRVPRPPCFPYPRSEKKTIGNFTLRQYACGEVQPLSSYGGMLALCTLPDRGVLLHRLSAPRLEGAQAGVCDDCKSHRGLSCPLALRVTT